MNNITKEPIELLLDDLPKMVKVRFRNMCQLNWEFVDGKIINQPIKTIGDLLRYSRPELLRRPNVGETTLDALEHVLAELHLRLREHEHARCPQNLNLYELRRKLTKSGFLSGDERDFVLNCIGTPGEDGSHHD